MLDPKSDIRYPLSKQNITMLWSHVIIEINILPSTKLQETLRSDYNLYNLAFVLFFFAIDPETEIVLAQVQLML